MRSKLHGPSLVAFAILALSCAGRDTKFSCEPTLTCTMHDSRFDPGDEEDAGPDECRTSDERCRAGQIEAGGRHACAAARAGELFCWGDNSEGQLGGRTLPDAGAAMEPDDAGADAGARALLSHVDAFSCGGAHTCALTSAGELYCWGRDAEGQVDGVASEQPVHAPELVALTKPTAVSAGGSHTCAIAEGGVWCWGDDRFGQCGGEVMDGAVEPQLVAGTEDVVELAAGVRHTCARTKDARVLCWGELIGDDGEPAPTAEARLVPKLDHVREITAGAGHACALRDDGRVWCWGHNESGQLGDGTTTSRATPMQVPALERSLHIAAGGLDLDGELVGHTCVETREFNARCWGRNNEGQLGTGTAESSTVPTTVLAERDESSIRKYLDEVVSITTGGQFSCSLDNNGPVRCWGTNKSGQLGLPRGEDADFGRPSNVRRFSRPE